MRPTNPGAYSFQIFSQNRALSPAQSGANYFDENSTQVIFLMRIAISSLHIAASVQSHVISSDLLSPWNYCLSLIIGKYRSYHNNGPLYLPSATNAKNLGTIFKSGLTLYVSLRQIISTKKGYEKNIYEKTNILGREQVRKQIYT